MPRKVLESDSSLIRSLEEDSEILQNITDQFAPLMPRFHIYFFWEQERMDLKYTKDYIVDETSAAPILDDTERSGIAADHRNMVKFDTKDSPGFRTVVAALKRWAQDAPGLVRTRVVDASTMVSGVSDRGLAQPIASSRRILDDVGPQESRDLHNRPLNV